MCRTSKIAKNSFDSLAVSGLRVGHELCDLLDGMCYVGASRNRSVHKRANDGLVREVRIFLLILTGCGCSRRHNLREADRALERGPDRVEILVSVLLKYVEDVSLVRE